ncbi:hypothetical protein GN958_ATG00389 [Phytophthora infestans]|uniref:Uncharacterized protein n=1 Tax=Phytophthora infestans TaxID=4787 RepID=A0A8S9VE18_PHYIN|nr:hypothetical protein GN958_ATG00389 [Phytophthora infestans]
MLLRPATCAVRRAPRVASFASRSNRRAASSILTKLPSQRLPLGVQRCDCAVVFRDLSTTSGRNKDTWVEGHDAGAPTGSNPRMNELIELFKESRMEGHNKRELKQSMELYALLKLRNQPDADTFEVAFGIAQIYDNLLEDGQTATKYYGEAFEILETISTNVTAWGAYMRVTTLAALAVCHENLVVASGQSEEAATYFEDAIGAYEEHCDQASALDADGGKISGSDISLLADLNATAAMVHYHYAGNLLARNYWDEAKTVTKIALGLAENSSMPAEDLQQYIHELWLG